MPTANVQLRRYRSPLNGVFAVVARASCGGDLQSSESKAEAVLQGVANVGVRPTVSGDSKPILEVHLFDFDGDLYGRHLQVEFLAKLRNEQKFDSIDRLKAQIYHDIERAHNYFAGLSECGGAAPTI